MVMLNSSNLSACDYDEASQTLTISFNGGGEYAYRGVPKSVFDALQTSPSPGSYFAQAVRGKYQTEKLS